MTASSSLPSFPSTLSWSKDEIAQKVKYILARPTSRGSAKPLGRPFISHTHSSRGSFPLSAATHPHCMGRATPPGHLHLLRPLSSSSMTQRLNRWITTQVVLLSAAVAISNVRSVLLQTPAMLSINCKNVTFFYFYFFLRKFIKAGLADDLVHTVSSNKYSAPFPPAASSHSWHSQVTKHFCSKIEPKKKIKNQIIPSFVYLLLNWLKTNVSISVSRFPCARLLGS